MLLVCFSYDYDDLLSNSTFCLVPRGRRLASFRFLEAMQHNCIPVILSNGWDLPFSEVIDWSKFSIMIDERRLMQVPSILHSITNNVILAMKQQLVFVWKNYFSSIKSIVYTVIEVIFETALIKPYLPTQSAFTCSKLTVETLEQRVKYVQS